MLSYGDICDMGGCLGREMSAGKCMVEMSGGKMSGEKMSGGNVGGRGRNVGIPKINSHLLERHKQLMFVIQSSVRLLKFSSTFQ